MILPDSLLMEVFEVLPMRDAVHRSSDLLPDARFHAASRSAFHAVLGKSSFVADEKVPTLTAKGQELRTKGREPANKGEERIAESTFTQPPTRTTSASYLPS